MQRYRKGKTKGRTVYKHRRAMEVATGRTLSWDEVVHHKNEDKTDNRPENLEVMSRRDHSRLHLLKHPLTRPCEVCGATFEPTPSKRTRDRSCSPPCRATLISEGRSGVRIDAALERRIRSCLASGKSQRACETELGVSRTTIRRLLAGQLRVRA